MAKKDRIVGAVVALLGVLFVILTIVLVPNKAKGDDPGPRLFPLIGSIGMIIFGIGMVFDSLKKANQDKPAKKFLDKAGWIRVGEISALFIVYVLGLKYLGFLLCTPFFVFALVTLFLYDKKQKIWIRIIFSLVTTGVIYLIFVKLLSVMLPGGSIW